MDKWKKGLLIGAAIGFLVTMIDRQEREKMKRYSNRVKGEVKSVYHNPSHTISRLRYRLDDVTKGTDRLIDQLNQIESFFSKYEQK